MNFKDSGQAHDIGKIALRRQDLLCLSLYYLGFSWIRNLFFRVRRIPVARILAFHDVSPDQVQSFRKKIETVKAIGNIVSLDDILAGRMSPKKINVAITFDDGYRGWIDNVFPILRELGVTATFFVSSGFVGLRGEGERGFLRTNLKSNKKTTGSLTGKELRKLSKGGFSIGGHTCNHVNMAALSDINELRCEIQIDKMELEKITGTKVEYFAYPFGFYQNLRIDLVRILRESGYRGALTLVPGLINADTNSYCLHRDLVSASMPMPVFKARLLGNQDGVMFLRRMFGVPPVLWTHRKARG
jgi:peptidoglycan/xylan/chitin deacetylase (PgdA/CDA1 family)